MRNKKLLMIIMVLLCSFLITGCAANSRDMMNGLIDSLPIEIPEEISDIQIPELNKLEQLQLIPSLPSENIAQSSGTMEVHFLDVGQGDCTLIINSNADGTRKCMLIDAGNNNSGTKVQAYLEKQGIDYIDLFIITHADEDHEGGADVIITKFNIGSVWMSDMPKDTYTHSDVLEALSYRNMSFTEPVLDTTFSLEDATVSVVGPTAKYEDTNNNSICVKITKGSSSFLFCGDAEELAESDMANSDIDISADVYHVNHHGSNTSSTENYLRMVDPEYAVISVGEHNDYWHPHGSTLNTLRKFDISVYRTDEQGTVIASTDGKLIKWNTVPSETWQAGTGPQE